MSPIPDEGEIISDVRWGKFIATSEIRLARGGEYYFRHQIGEVLLATTDHRMESHGEHRIVIEYDAKKDQALSTAHDGKIGKEAQKELRGAQASAALKAKLKTFSFFDEESK